MRPHDAADRLTRLARVTFDPAALRPNFDRFLLRVVPSEAIRRYLQRTFGYALTGDVGEQVLFFLLGPGANGKSVLASALLDLMGDYAKPGAPDLLLAKHGESHPVEIAALRGARAVVCSEVEEGRHLAEARVKLMTGGDELLVRGMRENFYSISPTWKIWLLANHRPQVRGGGDALWRRIVLLPFDQVIPKAERDPKLREKLRAESSGILNWAIEGCVAWSAEGLGQLPAEVVSAVSEYQAAQDNIARFIGERCTPVAGAWVSSDELHTAYRDACQAAGEYWKPKEAFGERLKASGFRPQKRGGRRGWVGVRLVNLWGQDALDATGQGFPVDGSIESLRGANGESLSTVSSASNDGDFP